jgi:hypothetical protein
MPADAHTSRDGAYLLRVFARRAAFRWRFLGTVTAVLVLVATLLSALAVLAASSDAGALRGGLTDTDPAATSLTVDLLRPSGSLTELDSTLADTAADVLGPDIPTKRFTLTESALRPVTRTGPPLVAETALYASVGELTDAEIRTSLVDGAWASDDRSVVAPGAARTVVGLAIGDELVVQTTRGDVALRISGFYRLAEASARAPAEQWAIDPLQGGGAQIGFAKPGQRSYEPVVAIGPLLAAPGTLEARDVSAAFSETIFRPDFTAVDESALSPLRERLVDADVSFSSAVGRQATTVALTTELPQTLDAVGGGILVTRTVVAVSGALLALLAVTALVQVARLVTESGAVDRRLMRSRGASPAQVGALVGLEAVSVAVVTALVAPGLGALVYQAMAAVPAMRAARMPAAASIPLAAWLVAAGVAVVFVAIVAAPLLVRRGAEAEFDAEQDSAARAGRLAPLMRSGLDLAVIAVAVVAALQLFRLQGTVRAGTLGVDPIAAVAPAIVLLGAVLLCLRLMPLVAAAAERRSRRARGAASALASWELARRSRSSIAAVLLVAVTLAVGIFSVSFLETWRQSQADQAAFAVGPPVRLAADGRAPSEQVEALTVGATSGTAPSAALRRDAVASWSDGSPSGSRVHVLGLDESARRLIDTGRLGEEGGTEIATALAPRDDADDSGETLDGIAIDDDVTWMGVTVTALPTTADPADTPTGVRATVSAITVDVAGILTVDALGTADLDGQPHALLGPLSQPSAGRTLVGLQLRFEGEPATRSLRGSRLPVSMILSDAGARSSREAAPVALDIAPVIGWAGVASDHQAEVPTVVSAPSPSPLPSPTPSPAPALAVSVDLPQDLAGTGAVASLVAWEPVTALPVVVPTDQAARLGLGLAAPFVLTLGDAAIPSAVAGMAPAVPGAVEARTLVGGTAGLAATSSDGSAAGGVYLVADSESLARALAQYGAAGTLLDEWWVDVPAGSGEAYVVRQEQAAAAGSGADGGSTDVSTAVGSAVSISIDGVTRSLQEGPLRIGTQAALWLTIITSAVLIAIGFGMHSAGSLRRRRLEFAQLRAVGFGRRGILSTVSIEAGVLSAVGIVFGIVSGVVLAQLLGPLVSVSPTGAPPVPEVRVVLPAGPVVLLVVELIVVVGAMVVAVWATQRLVEPARLLREGAPE